MARIAIVGAGITGLGAARELHDNGHEVTVFEVESRVGGHTHTVAVEVDGVTRHIDTGFIVYNERTYPNFIALLDRLGVKRQPTTMGFSVMEEGSSFEYAGTSLATLAPSWKLKCSYSHWRMIADIVRFNRQVKKDLANEAIPSQQTLGEYLRQNGFSQAFRDRYLMPMGAAIWSTPEHNMEQFEALFFARFFYNHGLLEIHDRPQWYTLIGGSNAYLAPLTEPYRDQIRCSSPVTAVDATDNGVRVTVQGHEAEQFDGAVLACHSDQARAIYKQPTDAQSALLAAVPYLDNEVVMHTDASLMPHHRSCWAAWNYMLQSEHPDKPILT
ncbi:MAG: NAD(P)/FAD-dependent oxidoreductase, partial [Litorivicinus sp.]